MFEIVELLLRKERILAYQNKGVLLVTVADEVAGITLASSILYGVVDEKTVLYLSGGKTPKSFYKHLAQEEQLLPGAVGLVDERFGEPFHEDSNGKMIRDTGFLRYLQMRDIRFHPILQLDKSREEVAANYDYIVRSHHTTFSKSVGILGIGQDGHTAGLPAQSSKVKIENSKLYTTYDLVTEYNDVGGVYGERVTMTFLGLSMFDLLVVLVFGEEKKKALDLIFSEGSEEVVPGRFYKRPEIAMKTVLITDQTF